MAGCWVDNVWPCAVMNRSQDDSERPLGLKVDCQFVSKPCEWNTLVRQLVIGLVFFTVSVGSSSAANSGVFSGGDVQWSQGAPIDIIIDCHFTDAVKVQMGMAQNYWHSLNRRFPAKYGHNFLGHGWYPKPLSHCQMLRFLQGVEPLMRHPAAPVGSWKALLSPSELAK